MQSCGVTSFIPSSSLKGVDCRRWIVSVIFFFTMFRLGFCCSVIKVMVSSHVVDGASSDSFVMVTNCVNTFAFWQGLSGYVPFWCLLSSLPIQVGKNVNSSGLPHFTHIGTPPFLTAGWNSIAHRMHEKSHVRVVEQSCLYLYSKCLLELST